MDLTPLNKTIEINKYALEANSVRKRLSPDGAQTHTSHSSGNHPNHLDHQHFMLFPCLNSPLSTYWSDQIKLYH